MQLEVLIMILSGQESLRSTPGPGFRTCLAMKMAAFYKVKKGGLVQSALGFPQLLKLIRSFVQSQNNFKGINEF